MTKVCFSDVTKPHRSDDRRYMYKYSPGLPFLDSETPALFSSCLLSVGSGLSSSHALRLLCRLELLTLHSLG
jgi:hypothetical protein